MTVTRALGLGYGAVLGLWLFAGRSSIARLGVSGFDGPLGELRFWLAAAMALIAFVAVLGRMGTPQRGVRLTGLKLIAFCIFVLAWWLLTGIDTSGPDAASKAVDLLTILVALIATLAISLGPGRSAVQAGTITMVTALSICFIGLGLFELVAGTGGSRLAVLGGGPNVYARLVAFAGLWAAVTSRDGKMVLRAGLIGITGLLVVLSGSRGGLGAFILALLCALVAQPMRRAVFSGAALAVIAAIVGSMTTLGRAAVATFQSRVLELTFEDRYSAGRGEIYRLALEYVRRDPWLGNGLAAFAQSGWPYPHNLPLEAAVDGGIIFAVVVVVLLLLTQWRAYRLRGDRSIAIIGVWAVLIAVAAQFSGDVYDSRFLFICPALLLVPSRTPSASREALG